MSSKIRNLRSCKTKPKREVDRYTSTLSICSYAPDEIIVQVRNYLLLRTAKTTVNIFFYKFHGNVSSNVSQNSS